MRYYTMMLERWASPPFRRAREREQVAEKRQRRTRRRADAAFTFLEKSLLAASRDMACTTGISREASGRLFRRPL